MDPALRLRLAAVADEAVLWQRLEWHLWRGRPRCADCEFPSPLRLLVRRRAPAHWRCPACGVDYRATQATPLHALPGLPLSAWCWSLVHLQHFGRPYSPDVMTLRPVIDPSRHRQLQQVAAGLLATGHALVEVLLAPRLSRWQLPSGPAAGSPTTRTKRPTGPAPGR